MKDAKSFQLVIVVKEILDFLFPNYTFLFRMNKNIYESERKQSLPPKNQIVDPICGFFFNSKGNINAYWLANWLGNKITVNK